MQTKDDEEFEEWWKNNGWGKVVEGETIATIKTLCKKAFEAGIMYEASRGESYEQN